MEYQVVYKDDKGQDQISPRPMREAAKNSFIAKLDENNIEYFVKEVPDKLWHCPKVVFDIQKIEEARKAVAEGKELPGIMYTCGDEKEIAKKDKIVAVRLRNNTIKNAYVIDVWMATYDEVIAFKKRIGYEHLSPIVDII